ncbi:unnamed protein product [Ambrosiozyma monospora]|uniref:Unnamed protein product n=1 Tax=Ambrosiozyma monospora TaxID=43982 RepID=A0A9W6Z0S0_AMBMO|nr:unnamed protein product [Ambrosiozyma monospora]
MSSHIPPISFPEDLPPAAPSSIIPKQHKTLVFLIKLLRGSGYSLIAVYVLTTFLIKPLLKLSFDRRLEFSKFVFDRLNQVYQKLGKQIKYIPSVVVNYKGVIYKDSAVSTDDNDEDQVFYHHTEVTNVNKTISEDKTVKKGVRFLDEEAQAETIFKQDYKKLSLDASDELSVALNKVRRTLLSMKMADYQKQDAFSGSMINRYNGSSISEMQPLLFQLSQFKNYLEVTTSDHPKNYMFKRQISYLTNGYGAGGYSARSKTLNLVDDLHSSIDEVRTVVSQKKFQEYK